MQAEVQTIGPSKKKISIEVSADEVKQKIEENIGEIRRQAILPGFRRGHAPLTLIEKRFGADIRKEVKANLVYDNYRKAVEEKELRPIADPDINIDAIELKEGEPFKYEVELEVFPEFEATGYEGLKLEKPSTEPTEEELNREIEALRMRTTNFEEVTEGGAEEKDFVIASYAVTIDGAEAASARESGIRPTDEVVGRMKVPGLKDAIVGKKAGDSVSVDFKVDEEHYEEALRGKDAKVTLTINGIRRPHVPEVSDEWAKELGFESLEELKTVVSRNAAAAKESQAEEALRAQVYDKLLEMINFDLPEDAVRRQKKEIMARETMNLRYRGASDEDLAKVSDKLEEVSQERAARSLKILFILSRIAEKEGITATEADVDMRVAELASRYRTTTAKMRSQLESEEMLPQLSLEIREEKTVSFILSKAEISEAAPAEGAEKPKKPRIVVPGESEGVKGGKLIVPGESEER